MYAYLNRCTQTVIIKVIKLQNKDPLRVYFHNFQQFQVYNMYKK